MNADTQKYNDAQSPEGRSVCELLARAIDRTLPEAENKIWQLACQGARHSVGLQEPDAPQGSARTTEVRKVRCNNGSTTAKLRPASTRR
jgi:hypothetical protein